TPRKKLTAFAMLLLGIDIGTSSIKVSVVDAASQKAIAAAHYPETETGIIALKPGWAEQSPDMWWEHVQLAILKLHAQRKYDHAARRFHRHEVNRFGYYQRICLV